jgi:hypothetical protein
MMRDWLDSLQQLLLPWWPQLLAASLAMALVSILLIPLLLIQLPADHFVARPVQPPRHPLLFASLWLLRNLLALLLFVAGVLMLFLPGQGLLTLLLAAACADLPGKQRLERALLRRPLIFQGANWIRKRYHRPPFIHPDESNDVP